VRRASATTRSTTQSWTCPQRSRPSNTAQASSRLKINGELVILIDGRLSFDALQRRLVTAPSKARGLVASVPASYVAFDLLALAGVDMRTQRWTNRRRRLESLASWTPPLQLSMVTDNHAEAHEWFEVLPTMGVEGLVAKGKASRYEPGRRGWLKVNSVGVSSARNIYRVALCLVRSSAPGGWLCTTGVADIW
jgi:ATP-dependent DNA ligase